MEKCTVNIYIYYTHYRLTNTEHENIQWPMKVFVHLQKPYVLDKRFWNVVKTVMRHGHHDRIGKAWKRSEYVDKNFKIFGSRRDHRIFHLMKSIYLDIQ